MAVVFRPADAAPDAAAEDIFLDGEWIPQALLLTEDLPKGFPTAAFAPVLVQHRYAIRVHIDVLPGKLLLSVQPQRGPLAIPGHPLSYMVFARDGLPLTMAAYEPDRGVVETAGRLYPLCEPTRAGW